MAEAPPFGASRRQDALTRREIEIIRLVTKGLSGREVARQLCRSPRTVENHLRSVYQKLNVRNRVELVRAAADRDLLNGVDSAPSPQASALLEVKGRTLDIIHALDSRMARADNDRYFGELALALAEALRVRWAGISEQSTREGRIDIIVMAADGKLAEQSSCQAEGSPCGRTIAQGSVVVLNDVAGAFPHWPLATELGVRSYVGVRLDDRLLGPVGTLWVMHDKPLDAESGVELILRLFGRRTAAELALAQTLDRLSPGAGDQEAGTQDLRAT